MYVINAFHHSPIDTNAYKIDCFPRYQRQVILTRESQKVIVEVLILSGVVGIPLIPSAVKTGNVIWVIFSGKMVNFHL